MKSSNPVLSRPDAFSRGGYATWNPEPSVSTAPYGATYGAGPVDTRRMTIDDVVIRTGMLLATVFVTGAAAWVFQVGFGVAVMAMLAAFVIALIVSFKRVISPPLILTYAALEGVALGAISRFFEASYGGIVVQAVLATMMTFAGMLFAYKSGRIRVTPRFQKMVIGAMFGLLGLMLVNLVAGFFIDGGLGLRDGGPLAIIFSLVAIGVAALSLALDFDMVERGVAAGAPEKESWLAAFGLVVTLVWLYVEMLRFISYFRD
ncbi:MAG: Bax inhibitor-1/YccA family protein [Actinomycetota bacterium]|nr:Bax inhibitor-1/YccA family protein [Actinomycetota bacterium]